MGDKRKLQGELIEMFLEFSHELFLRLVCEHCSTTGGQVGGVLLVSLRNVGRDASNCYSCRGIISLCLLFTNCLYCVPVIFKLVSYFLSLFNFFWLPLTLLAQEAVKYQRVTYET